MKRAPWLPLAAFALVFVVMSTLLHPMELADHNSEIDGFVASAESLRGGTLPMDPFRPLLFPITVAAGSGALGPFGAARLVSNLSTIVLVLVSFLLARRAFDSRVAWLTAGGMVLSPHILVEGQLATSDMLFSALALLTVYLALRLHDRLTPGRMVALAAAFAAAWFTRYQAAVLVPVVIWAFAGQSRRPWLGRLSWLGAWGAVTVVLLIPHFVLNTLQFGSPLFNMNWANLALKLYGEGDWSYLERVPFEGWADTIAHDPLRFVQVSLDSLAELFPGVLVYLMGGGAAGAVLASLALLGVVRLVARQDGRVAWPTLLFGLGTLVAVAVTFHPYPRFLLAVLPLLLMLSVEALLGLFEGVWSRRLVFGLLGLLLAWTCGQRLLTFSSQHPVDEVVLAQDLSEQVGHSVVLGSTYYALGWRVDNPVQYLRDPLVHETEQAWYEALGRFAIDKTLDYVVVGQQSLRQRPASLLRTDQVPLWLEEVHRYESAVVYQVRRELIPMPGAPVCALDPEKSSGHLDDLEDGDTWIRCAGDREGFWRAYADATGGEVLLEPVSPGALDSQGALRLQVTGFTDWGAGASIILRQRTQRGARSPYDASAFQGIRFLVRARAPTTLQLKLADRWSHPDAGLCQAMGSCYDHHLVDIPVDTEWRRVEVAFSELAQAGWGELSRGPDGQALSADDGQLDPASLYAILFQLSEGDADLYLDEVELWTQETP